MSARHFGLPQTTAHHLTPGQVRSGARHHAPPVEARCNPISEDRISFWFWSAFIISVFAIPLLCAAVISWFQ
jgi:hypothetical protein